MKKATIILLEFNSIPLMFLTINEKITPGSKLLNRL